MSNPTVPHVTPSHNFILQAEQRKADLVDIGLYALSHGHWQMVEAITRVMHERGWGHA